MESRPGSQWLAPSCRRWAIPSASSRRSEVYVKSNKNDIIDAAAIAEAARRPTMRFVGIKQADQVDLQMLHWVRIPMKPATDSDLKPAIFRADPGSV
ncbi:transposase [Rhizobium leguminosarum]|uniref:IS110 family transposase n=1 Tax=Rhizobium leguminosarum TaxID=384 RepID=UPI0021BBE72B